MVSKEDFLEFTQEALDLMVGILEDLGDDLVNRRPDLPGANSPYAILFHCLGVMEYWGGQVVAGRTIERDREAEFRAEGRVAELRASAEAALARLRSDLEGLEPSAPPLGEVSPEDRALPLGRSRGGALVHLYEELERHLGQMELTRDIIRAPWGKLA